MKTLTICAMAMIASAPVPALSQDAPASLQHPSARDPFVEQLRAVAARIDRREADGRLSRDDADHARLEINDLEAQIADVRVRDGGQLTEADRFALQDQIHKLEDKLNAERPAVGAPH